MKRLYKVSVFLFLFLSFDAFSQVRDKIDELGTKNAHKAALYLTDMGEKIVPELRSALSHSNLQVRQFVTAILCDLSIKACHQELTQKIASKKVSYSEKLFYASFLYSSESEAGREFLVKAVQKESDLNALQALVDAYDRDNLEIFLSLLKENIEKDEAIPSEKKLKMVKLCIRGIKISGNATAINQMDKILSKSSYSYN